MENIKFTKSIYVLGVSLLTCAAVTPASSADLGGNCCADLEERVAELEATTARKGNRKVSLTVSGFLNEGLLVWDDGGERNAYVVTNESAPDRVRFVGEASIAVGWNAGYMLELGTRGARGDRVTQSDPDGGSSANGVYVRHSAWYLSGKDYGKVWVGQTSDAADGITEINLANTSHFSYTASWGNTFGDGGAGFFVRRNDGVLSGLHWGNFVAQGAAQGIPGEGHRWNVVKYDSPTIAGFTLSAAWGEDDLWNVGLRYAGEFNGFKLAGGIAYTEDNDFSSAVNRRGAGATSEVGLSGSLMHLESGLYVSGAWGTLHDAGLDDLYGRNVDENTSFYTVQAGLERKFFPIGKTTIFGEYFQLDRGAGFVASGSTASILNAASLGTGLSEVSNSQIRGWGVGVNQNLNQAIDIYLSYRHVDLSVATTNASGTAHANANLDPFQAVMAGAQIKF